MSYQLSEGVELWRVFFNDGSVLTVDESCSHGKVESMTVSMQPGQCGLVPWVRVVYSDHNVNLFNCAHLEGVGLLDDDGEDDA